MRWVVLIDRGNDLLCLSSHGCIGMALEVVDCMVRMVVVADVMGVVLAVVFVRMCDDVIVDVLQRRVVSLVDLLDCLVKMCGVHWRSHWRRNWSELRWCSSHNFLKLFSFFPTAVDDINGKEMPATLSMCNSS